MPLHDTDDPLADTRRSMPRQTGQEADNSPLGPRPQIGNFSAIRARLRARILDVDITNLDSSLTYPITSQHPSLTPEFVGRYSILALLGRGGMGAVYLAYDQSLDRKLAIKLLDQAPPEYAARLRLEARAMARLSHPNAVMVHEVGEHEGQLYIAMEYVKGLSLRQWLDIHPRSWRQILQVFLQAGEGLAAAHAAGIIHRDFKPANVLIGDDGRVRVADFGLAWTYRMTIADTQRTEPPAPTDCETSAELDTDDLIAHQTKTGTILGTLAFMAPEQYRGETPTVAADLFSYCVALYQALYGHLPFDATSASLYRQLAHNGKVRPAKAGTKVPLWLRSIILRGLDPQVERRWDSLPELLAALRQGQRPRLPLPAIALAFTGLATLATLATLPHPEAPTMEPCSSEETLLTLWSPAARDSIRSRYLVDGGATKRARAWRTIDTALTRYSDRWTIEYTRACQLRRSLDPETAALAERISTCLNDHKIGFYELVSQLGNETTPEIETAVLAATGIPSPELCRQTAPSTALPTGRAAPSDLGRVRLLAARRQLARANVDIEFHRLSAARSILDEILNVAQEHSDPPLEAESLLALSRAERADHEIQAAKKSLQRARELVHRDPAQRALELRILIQLIDITGVGLGDLAGAEALASEATALHFAIGEPPLLAAYLANNLA
ncbi:MAG TPA: serine/threonine protein kinase, partial [Nannocystis exedens]|nr:serine/threonine protein kinase [Nannocystis exedens]